MPDGDAVAERLNELIASGTFDLVVATRDWHPPDHWSFTEQGGPWPVHCVAGTPGAELHPALDPVVVDVIVDTGRDPDTEGYSGFDRTDLAALLRDHGIDHVTVAGLATDYCVRATALDALCEGFAVTLDTAASRGIEPATSERALDDVRAAGGRSSDRFGASLVDRSSIRRNGSFVLLTNRVRDRRGSAAWVLSEPAARWSRSASATASAWSTRCARAEPCRRADIARSTGLSRSTVSSLVADLQAAGLVREGEQLAGIARGGQGGRPPVLLALDTGRGALLGIDFGHDHLRVAVADLSYAVLAEQQRRARRRRPARTRRSTPPRASPASCSTRPAWSAGACSAPASGCPGRSTARRASCARSRSCPAGSGSTPPPSSSGGSRLPGAPRQRRERRRARRGRPSAPGAAPA